MDERGECSKLPLLNEIMRDQNAYVHVIDAFQTSP